MICFEGHTGSNYRPAVDARTALQLAFGHHWPGTAQAECSAT